MTELFWDFALRLFVAGAMGVLIGLEREYRAKEAGYRTHFFGRLGKCIDYDCFSIWLYGCVEGRFGPS